MTAVIGAPHLRRDGSLHDVAGYDPVTGLLYRPECEFDRIPERPTRDDGPVNLSRIAGKRNAIQRRLTSS